MLEMEGNTGGPTSYTLKYKTTSSLRASGTEGRYDGPWARRCEFMVSRQAEVWRCV